MLTGREIQVARCISRGMYEKEIADRLHISMATIHANARNIRKKIGAGNIADITRYYILTHDGIIRHRTRSAYQAGCAHYALRERDHATPDQPETGVFHLRTRADHAVAPTGVFKPRQAWLQDLLLRFGVAHGFKNQHDMTELEKIDILQWMYAHLSLPQLRQLQTIAKNMKEYERRCNDGSRDKAAEKQN